MKNFKFNGFTLAEVLITLGIIGVVAAMTIPTLISNTRSQQYRSKLKKTISTLSQAGKMSQARYGFDYAGITKECGNNAASEHPDNDSTICAILNGTLTGITYYNKASDIKMRKNGKDVSYSYQPNQHAYVLSDGTIVGFYEHLGQNGKGCTREVGKVVGEWGDGGSGTAWCFGFIDVNGANLPNKEVTCSKGSNALKDNTCVVKNDAKHLTDIYPIRFHDGTIEAATAATRYVMRSAK